MVKKTIMLCALCAGLIHAESVFESERFIGLEAGYSEVQGFHPDDTSENGNFGFRLGAQNEEWRTMLNVDFYGYESKDKRKKHNLERAFFSLDYFFMDTSKYQTVSMTPFFGVNVGYMNFESVGVDESGLLYGGQAGLKFAFVDAVEIDIAYRFSLGSAEALDHAGEAFVGINFKY